MPKLEVGGGTPADATNRALVGVEAPAVHDPSVAVYDARGQAVWSARQMALLPEARTLATTTYPGALPDMPAESGSVSPRVWDEVNTYVTTSRYDHAGRAIGLELPADPDWLLYGDSGDPSTPPVVGGVMKFDARGLPEEASLVVDGVASRIAHLTYDHFGRVTDTDIGNPDHHQVAHVDYDVRHRPVQAWFKRDPTTGGLPGDVLPGTRYPYWYHYTWDAANNLTRIMDVAGYANATFQDGHRQRTVHVTHDSLYRVAQVDFSYRAPNGRWTSHDAATDWRDERTRTNADGQTHRDVDPMDREPAEMVPALPAERVQNLTYQYDWLANMTEWTDDASAFYERSLGDIGNGAGHAGKRPSALYLATNISHSEPVADASADRGGYVEVDYGAGGNVLALTVHAQCRDASPTNVCYAEDPAVTDSDAVRIALRARCVCNADTEQHVQLRWDELNRLVEARRFDRDAGAWTLAVRQRHRHDGNNVRLIKETLDVDQPDPSLRQRITLSVMPDDFERAGVYADLDGTTSAYRGAEALHTETQYSVAGARLVGSRGEEAGALSARHRLTYGLADLIQSTSAVIDLESGELSETTTFYPNGARETHRTTTKASAPVEPVGFTGKEEDEEVGLTYFGERWLIPRLGRWASVDPLSVHAMGGGEIANSYHYVSGNILQGRDPIGLVCGIDESCDELAGDAGSGDTQLSDGEVVQRQNHSAGRTVIPPDPELVRRRGQVCAHLNCHGAGFRSASEMGPEATPEQLRALTEAGAWALAGEIGPVGIGIDVYDAVTTDDPVERTLSAGSAVMDAAGGGLPVNRGTARRVMRALRRARAVGRHGDEAVAAADAAVDAERASDGLSALPDGDGIPPGAAGGPPSGGGGGDGWGPPGSDVPDGVVVCRGGVCTAERFEQGSGVTLDGDGRLQGVSVDVGHSLEEATTRIPNGQVGATTADQVRAAGGSVVHSPTPRNPNHATMSGLTPQQAQDLFTPTVPNPQPRSRR